MPTNERPTRRSLRRAATIEGDLDASGRDRETRRELAKLTANYLNALAASIFAVGALAPIVGYVSQTALWVAGTAGILLVLGGFALSLVTHLSARYVLRREFRR
jgi:hypothetical protein